MSGVTLYKTSECLFLWGAGVKVVGCDWAPGGIERERERERERGGRERARGSERETTDSKLLSLGKHSQESIVAPLSGVRLVGEQGCRWWGSSSYKSLGVNPKPNP